MPVQIAPVQSVSLRDASEYVAVLRARQSVRVQPQVEGLLTEISVASGRRVQAGDVLMQIDPTRQRAAVESQRASREASAAALDLARADLARALRLHAGGAITEQDFDRAKTALRQAEGNAASAGAQVQASKTQLRYYRVVAPAAGTVGDIPVRLGDLVSSQTLLTTLDDNESLEAYVNVPLERAASVKLGTTVEILDEAGKVLAPSVVTFISPRADPATQMILVKSGIDNRSGRLRSEQFVRARVVWARREGLVVPVLSVWSRAGQSFVWIVRDDQRGGLTVDPRAIEVGPIEGQRYSVAKGLRAGERIVVSGVQKLRPGAPVAPAPPGGAGPPTPGAPKAGG
jgi:RND family efflux transporter MFP subunit